MNALLRFLTLLLCLAAPLAARVVIIDAGHGGHDRGGMPGQRVEEKGYCLDVAKRLETKLRAAGYQTVMTRRSDVFVPLDTRCAIANQYAGRAIFVSIHFNGAANADASGIETYYSSGRASAALAASVHSSVLRATGAEDRRVRSRGFRVLTGTRMPAVLLELGFLTNRSEASRVKSSSYRDKLAGAVAAGIRSRF